MAAKTSLPFPLPSPLPHTKTKTLNVIMLVFDRGDELLSHANY